MRSVVPQYTPSVASQYTYYSIKLHALWCLNTSLSTSNYTLYGASIPALACELIPRATASNYTLCSASIPALACELIPRATASNYTLCQGIRRLESRRWELV
ncbi:hypothetical protein BDZ91DRAFT_327959 [Kalaharituber pfeilii]|nr:hypothetical protein BDZ91DRAFT_327959 [Kalaharituber pfeilii]